MEKGFLQMSFTWLFAILVGGFILFLAIYAVITVKPTEELVQDVKLGKEISFLLNPLETGFETSKTTYLELPVETRIYNKCYSEDGVFGAQVIQVSQRSYGEFTDPSFEIEVLNKYLFSGKIIEGKTFNIFVKPFEFPFKVADLIYIIPESEEYCFKDAPTEISEEIERLNQVYLSIEGDEGCSEKSKKVCFESSNCDINVLYDNGVVEKDGEQVYFDGDALMYAAIFSNLTKNYNDAGDEVGKSIYECQLKRLMQRTEQLARLYSGKASFIAQTAGCSNTNLNLVGLESAAGYFEDSGDLALPVLLAENIGDLNELNSECKLW